MTVMGKVRHDARAARRRVRVFLGPTGPLEPPCIGIDQDEINWVQRVLRERQRLEQLITLVNKNKSFDLHWHVRVRRTAVTFQAGAAAADPSQGGGASVDGGAHGHIAVVKCVVGGPQRWRLSWPLSPSGRRCWPPRKAFRVRFSSCRCPGAAARGPCRSTSTLRRRRSCCCSCGSGSSGAMLPVHAGATKHAARDR